MGNKEENEDKPEDVKRRRNTGQKDPGMSRPRSSASRNRNETGRRDNRPGGKGGSERRSHTVTSGRNGTKTGSGRKGPR